MPEPSPTILIVETSAGDPPVEFLGPSSDLVYFLSMAHSERYGAAHPLARAGFVLKRQLRVNISPLLNFGDARTESSEERELLDRLWQDAAPVYKAAREAAEAIDGTPELQDLTADFPDLTERLRELADMAAWAEEQGAQVRLTYVL
jgi:hypothetical protein